MAYDLEQYLLDGDEEFQNAEEILNLYLGPPPSPTQIQLDSASATEWAKQQTVVTLPQLDSAGLTAVQKALKIAQTAATRNRDSNAEDFFKILYTNVKGQKKSFVFALLPAIDSNINKGSSQVPDVKPGILIRTSVRQKSIPVPGGVPIIQTIGVDNTVLQVVGAFIGTERITNQKDSARGDLHTIYQGVQKLSESESSERKANLFMKEVVHSGRPIEFHSKSVSKTTPDGKSPAVGMELKYQGVIVNFKYFAARRNRTYYSIDMLISDYDVNKK
jgi:enoyl reductase-like protein